jgi:twitching motility protein PilT
VIPIDSPQIGLHLEQNQQAQAAPLRPQDTDAMMREISTPEQYAKFLEHGELDFSYSIPGAIRVRVNVFKQRGSVALAVRLLKNEILSFSELGLPRVLEDLSRRRHGLVLITGPTGSGKSTTLASMIELMNRERQLHIITLEDPIEYLFKHNMCTINQREIGEDTRSFSTALRASLRAHPDVIMVGELHDLKTISIALKASETGHLVLATLHTKGAPETIDRIIDVFPPYQQQQVRIQLAGVLEGVLSQLLLPKADRSGLVVAVEVLVTSPATRNVIREGKTYQLLSHIQTGIKHGMISLDTNLKELYQKGLIDKTEALYSARDPENLKLELDQIRQNKPSGFA